jgi:hypothetical protein
MSRALPMDPNQRIMNYVRSPGPVLTPRQNRRRMHKLGHLAALERRLGHSPALSKKHDRAEPPPEGGVTP